MSIPNPSWMSQQRTLVPKNLQPGTNRSSFARPDEYKVNRPTITGTSSTNPVRQRTGFSAKPKPKTKVLNTKADASELPPSNSIHGVQTPDPDTGNSTLSAPVSANAFHRRDQTGIPLLVFGFPSGSTQNVLQVFSKFGEILENEQGAEDSNSSLVECGRNWLRITYKTKEAAQQALALNGSVMPGQYVIGCVLAESTGQTNDLQLSSTNSLLLDDSDASLVHDLSLTNYLDDSNVSSTSVNASSPNATNSNISAILPDKIIPKNPDSSLFNTTKLTKSKPVGVINSTQLPQTEEPKSTVGRIARKVADSIFGWDV